jgi:Flp pilus assembly protein TadG
MRTRLNVQLAGSFIACARGNLTIIFSLAMLGLALVAGSAIDYLGAIQARTAEQGIVDATALAVARAEGKSQGQRVKIGKDYFAANDVSGLATAETPTITVGSNTVQVSVKVNYRTSFMAIAGIRNIALNVQAEVPRPFQHKVELALVLDYSYSMVTSDKYRRMRDAATKLIDNLATSASAGSLKVGLVPFSAMVRTTLPASYVSQYTIWPNWTGCTQDRQYPYNTGVSTPTGNAATKYGYVDGGFENEPPYDCSVYDSRNLDIVPLTTDMAAVKAKLAAMSPVGNTNIPLGAEFGWHLLDPGAPFTEAAPYTDDLTSKYLILLTDGVQTSSQWGSDGARSVAHGNENLLSLCQGMKKKDITIFAIAYDITDPKITDLLQQCAPSNYYDPDKSLAELDAAFQDIANRIKSAILRLSQ